MFLMDEDLVVCNEEPRFHKKSFHVGFAKDRVAMGQVFLPVPRFSPVNIIPPMLRTHRHVTRYSNQDKRAKLGNLKQALSNILEHQTANAKLFLHNSLGD
jgi:hypothetical protein